tara:strand:- start:29551 stop:29763 length:213 start_codon:yes stop_codon:yes gene_type:complete
MPSASAIATCVSPDPRRKRRTAWPANIFLATVVLATTFLSAIALDYPDLVNKFTYLQRIMPYFRLYCQNF